MTWTQFMDMNSGGDTKEEPYEYIYIEAEQDEAITIFYNRFGHNPNRVSCTCCGDDYSITESESFEQATAHERNCFFDKECGKYVEKSAEEKWRKHYIKVSEYVKKEDILIIKKEDILPKERTGTIPNQGYIWVD